MIYFLGDVHGRFGHVLPAIRARHDARASVVFLGDIEAHQPLEEEIAPLTAAGIGVWFIHGNHDTDSRVSWENLRGSVRFTGHALKHRSTIFPQVYDRLADERADVLVTHEAPSCHPHGFAAINLLAQMMGVKTVFHGHHHDCRDYGAWEAKLGFRAYGVGLRGIMDLRGVSVLAGELDQVRGRDGR